jgi:predicted NAD-dependent protein-ADP-ribosyltransferase YbiA (DUF1768 family)
MASEKATYWMVLGVLALAVTNGFVREHSGWASRLADRSVAMADRASDLAAGYINMASQAPDRDDLRQIARLRPQLAQVRSAMARSRAEVVRVRVEGVRAQVMRDGVRAVINCPRQNFDVEIPEPAQIFEDHTF